MDPGRDRVLQERDRTLGSFCSRSRARNESSKTYLAGPEIVNFGGLNGPLLPHKKTTGKSWGLRPPHFPVGFAVGWAHLDPKIVDFRPDQPPGIRISFGAFKKVIPQRDVP